MCGFGGEVEGCAGVETLLSNSSGDEKTLACLLEGPVQRREEVEGVVGEDFGLGLGGLFAEDLNA